MQHGQIVCGMTSQPTVNAIESKNIGYSAIDLATSDVLFLIERRPSVTDHLLQRRLEAKPVTISTNLPKKEGFGFQAVGGAVNGGGVNLGLAQGEAQLRQVRQTQVLGHASRGFKQDGGANPPVDITQGASAIHVQGLRVAVVTRDVPVDGRPKF